MDALFREIHAHPYISLGVVSFLVFTSPMMAALRAVARKVGEKVLSVAGSLAITSIELSDTTTTDAVSRYLSQNGRTHSVGGECYDMTPRTIEASGKVRHIFYRNVAESLSLYFYKGAPILITPVARDTEGDVTKRARMRFINGTVDMKVLLTEAGAYLDSVQEEASRNNRAFSITTLSPDPSGSGISTDGGLKSTSEGFWDGRGEPVNYDPAEFPVARTSTFSHRLSFTDAHRQLFQDVRFWKENRQWYIDSELEYKRGYLLYGNPGTGKCLGKGTPILMYDGTIRPVEEVSDGDRVMGPDSLPKTVRGVTRGTETMYKVNPIKGDPYIVNESHILSVKKDGLLVNLSVRDWLGADPTFRARAKGWRTKVDFPSHNVPIDPYLLGLWLGDGTASKADVTTMDPEIEDFLRKSCESMGLHLHEGPPSGRATTWSFSTEDRGGKGQPKGTRNIMRQTLRALNVWENKHVPHIYKVNSREQRLRLLAGLIDTDGSLNDGGFEITQKSHRLADDIAFVARSLGFAAYVKPSVKVCCNSATRAMGTYYRVSISGDLSCVPTLLARKQAPPRRQVKDVLVTGISVEKLGMGEYFGFEVDGDGLFLLGDFTVTHNTSLISAIAHDLDIPVVIINLAGMSDAQFIRAWKQGGSSSQRIVLFEDFDTVFHGRKNVTGTLNFTTVLNAIDGIQGNAGCLLYITTNHIEHVDEAIGRPDENGESTRAGRVDVIIEIPELDYEGRLKICKRILRDDDEAKKMADSSPHTENPSRLTERCKRRALELLWDRKR